MLPDRVSVTDFIDLMNETYAFAYPTIVVAGELANLRISRGRWVYFDLKDDQSSLKCFGTVQQLPGPLEDGMLLEVRGAPRMHNLYGFSFNVQIIKPAGEGSLRRAAELLQAKLQAEGLFAEDRKRPLPYPPEHIGLITSRQSAAYADFVKILNARWGGMHIDSIDTQVQGDAAVAQIVSAIAAFNAQEAPPEMLVIIRGGGSADDLAAFSTEQVTRAVAASRIPTLVAIGHEVDVSLAELAADRRASTPSNAAELLTPDKRTVLDRLTVQVGRLSDLTLERLEDERAGVQDMLELLHETMHQRIRGEADALHNARQLLLALSPQAALQRGYAIVRGETREGAIVRIELQETNLEAKITKVSQKPKPQPGMDGMQR